MKLHRSVSIFIDTRNLIFHQNLNTLCHCNEDLSFVLSLVALLRVAVDEKLCEKSNQDCAVDHLSIENFCFVAQWVDCDEAVR